MASRAKKRFFLKHASSSALVVSLVIHAAIIIGAVWIVVVKVNLKDEPTFENPVVARPKLPPRKFHVPVKVKSKPSRMQQRIVSPNANSLSDIQLPEISGMDVGVDLGMENIDFDLGFAPKFGKKFDFFGAKSSGEKVCVLVHFGPDTLGGNPLTRMTAYTIRNRLKDLILGLPEFTRFNVACYYMKDTDAMAPSLMVATSENKKKLLDWMEPVNPLEGKYQHCFIWGRAGREINAAKRNWPTQVEGLPFYSPKWVYPYEVSEVSTAKYGKLIHWQRAVAWAILTQKPDTIFILTTNYLGKPPDEMISILEKMCRDSYSDKKYWPTINVVVLSKAVKKTGMISSKGGAGGKGKRKADEMLKKFDLIVRAFQGDISLIKDITKFMNKEERGLYEEYKQEYGGKGR